MKYLNNLCSLVTDDAKYTCEIKRGIVMAKAAINKKLAVFTRKLELHVRKKPVKRYIWSIALCGAEIGALREVDMMYRKSSEMWC